MFSGMVVLLTMPTTPSRLVAPLIDMLATVYMRWAQPKWSNAGGWTASRATRSTERVLAMRVMMLLMMMAVMSEGMQLVHWLTGNPDMTQLYNHFHAMMGLMPREVKTFASDGLGEGNWVFQRVFMDAAGAEVLVAPIMDLYLALPLPLRREAPPLPRTTSSLRG